MLDTVIFDIGGVLIDWVPERAFEPVLPADDLPAFLQRIGFDQWNRANDALASIAGSEDELARRFPADAEAIRAYRKNFLLTVSDEIPGTAPIVAELAARGVRLGALTNWAADMFALARPRFPVLETFGDIVVSGLEGIVKPDPRIYQVACRRLGVEPAQVVYVDDAAANVVAARELGMTALRFTGADRLRADLVDLGLL